MSERLAYRLPQVARLLGISGDTAWRWGQEKKIPSVSPGSGRRKTVPLPGEALKAWLREQGGQNQTNG
ncbi:MAG TPA: helix-turn-helix domain-containing protein [Thermogutta sp.]|nr:helix-turn-helix domain-containing protein [Thermogutta sp.]